MMSLLDRIANPNIADVAGRFEQGRQIGQQKLTKDLAGEILNNTLGSKIGMQAFQDMQKINPEAAMQLKQALKTDSDSDTQFFVGITKAASSIMDQGGTAQDVSRWLTTQGALAQEGGRPEIAQKMMQTAKMLLDPNQAEEVLRNLKATAVGFDDNTKGTSQREFDDLISGLSAEDQEKARRMKLGLDPRATGNALMTAMARGPEALEALFRATIGESAGKAAGGAAVKRSEEAFDSVGKIRTSILNLDEGIRLIDEGAETGPIMALLPSVRSTAIQLDNLQGRLGLDVIGNTTFGALSKDELTFALDVALPDKLKGPELRAWMVRKKDSQNKLSSYLTEVAQFLGTPGNTTADWIELQKVRQLDAAPSSGSVDLGAMSSEDLQKLRQQKLNEGPQ
jgi:hypothetical protein